MKIIIVGSKLFELSVFSRTLLKRGHTLILSEDREEIRHFVKTGVIDAIIANENHLQFIKECIAINPMLNGTLISDKSAKSFHEETEGLGILMQLPSLPEKNHALEFLKKLSHIVDLTTVS